jgi:hypothetical protein
MSLLAKLFIIVQCLLVMVYLGVASTLYQHRRDWRDSYGQMKQRYHEMTVQATKKISELRETVKVKKQFLGLKDAEINSLKREKGRADSDYQDKNTALSQKNTEFAKLQDTNRKLATAYDNAFNSVRSLRSSIKELQDNLNQNIRRRGVAEAQVARLKTTTLNLDTDVQDLAKEYSGVSRALRQKTLLIAMAEERGVNFASLLAGPPARLVRGRVSAVKTDISPALIVIDVGSDDRVEIGYPLSVYRGNVFVGKVIVERVEATASACRLEFAAEGQSIQPGDEVTTRLP